jgi:hypothetical protein
VLTIAVTGWFSAKTRTGPGIEAVGTNAELSVQVVVMSHYTDACISLRATPAGGGCPLRMGASPRGA